MWLHQSYFLVWFDVLMKIAAGNLLKMERYQKEFGSLQD
jgi:hypothetical protein